MDNESAIFKVGGGWNRIINMEEKFQIKVRSNFLMKGIIYEIKQLW